jgi:hypothetical protein
MRAWKRASTARASAMQGATGEGRPTSPPFRPRETGANGGCPDRCRRECRPGRSCGVASPNAGRTVRYASRKARTPDGLSGQAGAISFVVCRVLD